MKGRALFWIRIKYPPHRGGIDQKRRPRKRRPQTPKSRSMKGRRKGKKINPNLRPHPRKKEGGKKREPFPDPSSRRKEGERLALKKGERGGGKQAVAALRARGEKKKEGGGGEREGISQGRRGTQAFIAYDTCNPLKLKGGGRGGEALR